MTHNDQASQLRQNVHRHHAKIAKTIAVVSGKGGVGKSNFTLNFALTLAEKEKSVLIVDLDIGMGNVDILLGVQSNYSIVDMYENHLSIHDIIEVGPNSLSYIAAGSGLSNVFHMDQNKFNYFLEQFEALTYEYDYIFFDMGAGATDDSLSYILAADECIVVTTPEPTSMMDAYAMIKHIYQRNMELPFYVLINRAESNKDGKAILSRLQKVTERFLSTSLRPLGIIPYDKVVSKAVIQQVPFTQFDSSSKASKSIQLLTDQYLSGEINIDHKSPSSFISRLKSFIKER
ncbi:flagellar biosynthesis protein FlhG [Pelagirhabdus alkalitolerans]|uniref:Flagellar biosynthesis protein FlhG n=1 Tax=Pelagirhabdus alkalitolerans TaxID=1612202 RepID=A0A1G6H5Y1_9BACI|nr:MinD/ParA family protein [Pelagirhabdus alkalitolerans]SDB88846.1 flagellar biosynthesis protein FlhG [Pelagirhabdus alkalitolerans]